MYHMCHMYHRVQMWGWVRTHKKPVWQGTQKAPNLWLVDASGIPMATQADSFVLDKDDRLFYM